MQALKAACISRNYQSFRDFKPGEYPVERFSVIETKFGNRIKVELKEVYLLLPERYNTAATPEGIADLNSCSKMMVYSGKDITNHNR